MIGLNSYQNKAPFHSSMLVYFRQRITPEIIEKINQQFVLVALEEEKKKKEEKGIRMSGQKLGRPPKNISKEEKKQAQLDERIRNRVEGIFGVGKRKYGLNLISTKLKETSETILGPWAFLS